MTTTLPPDITMGTSAIELSSTYHTFPQATDELVGQHGYGSVPEGHHAAWLSPAAECAGSLVLHVVSRPDSAVHATHIPIGDKEFSNGYYPIGLGKVMHITALNVDGEQYPPQLVCDKPVRPSQMLQGVKRIIIDGEA